VTTALLTERDERAPLVEGPHLSFSRINRYLHCPEQYRLYYIENLRPKFAPASLVFGQIVHQALAFFFREQDDPVRLFLNQWNEAKGFDLDYGERESWDKLRVSGQALLAKFIQEEVDRLQNVRAAEKTFELRISTLSLPLVGVIDLLADLDGKPTVVDFKTAASAYQEHEVILSDQLTAYQLAEPQTEQTALCVLVKTKLPKIEWHISERSPQRLAEFLEKIRYIAGEIAKRRFYKRPGKWCSWCDYLPVCTGDHQKVGETLVQVR